MRKFQFTWALIFVLVCIIILSMTVLLVFGQDTSKTYKPCLFDSSFIQQTRYRLERLQEKDDDIKSALSDRQESISILEVRLDSLRAIVREWSARQAKQSKKRKY